MERSAGAKRDVVGERVAVPFEDAFAKAGTGIEPRRENPAKTRREGRAQLVAGLSLALELLQNAVGLDQK